MKRVCFLILCVGLGACSSFQKSSDPRRPATESSFAFVFTESQPACIEGKANFRMLERFKNEMVTEAGFSELVRDFCLSGGEGEVFSYDIDLDAVLDRDVSHPISPPARLLLHLKKTPGLRAQSTAPWSRDRDYKAALDELLRDGQVGGAPGQMVFFPGKSSPAQDVFLFSPSAAASYMAAGVLGTKDFQDALVEKGLSRNRRNALFITRLAALDTLIHEYQHVIDGEEPSVVTKALEVVVQKNIAEEDSDGLDRFASFLTEGRAYLAQIDFLRSPWALQKKEWCSAQKQGL